MTNGQEAFRLPHPHIARSWPCFSTGSKGLLEGLIPGPLFSLLLEAQLWCSSPVPSLVLSYCSHRSWENSGSRTLAGAKLSEWEEPKAPSSHPGVAGCGLQRNQGLKCHWSREAERHGFSGPIPSHPFRCRLLKLLTRTRFLPQSGSGSWKRPRLC